MSKNLSPREVCSMTDGMIKLEGAAMWLLTAGGPEFRVGRLLFLFRRPERVARSGELPRDPLHLGRYPVEGVPQTHIVAQRLDPAALAQAQKRLVGVVAESVGLLAHERLDLLVRHVDAKLVCGGLEHELTCDRPGRLLVQPFE